MYFCVCKNIYNKIKWNGPHSKGHPTQPRLRCSEFFWWRGQAVLQLGPKFGGLGLRSLSHHAAAAFIASLSFSGLGCADNIHLQQAVAVFNTQVSLSNTISVNSVQDSPIFQKVLSGMIQAQHFHSLLESSSPANRARLLLVAAPHASSWLSLVPSPGLSLHLESNEYQMAIRWWLGLNTSGRSSAHSALVLLLILLVPMLWPAGMREMWSYAIIVMVSPETLPTSGPLTSLLLASYLAIHQPFPKSAVVAEIYDQSNIALVRSIARGHPGQGAPTLRTAISLCLREW